MASLRFSTLLLVSLVSACSSSDNLVLKDLTVVKDFTGDARGAAFSLAIDHGVAYVSTRAGFNAYQLNNGTDAVQLATYVVAPASDQSEQPLAIRGTTLAVAHGSRITLLDISTPASPTTLSTIEINANGAGYSLAFDGDYLYWGGINLQRANVSDLAHPGPPSQLSGQEALSFVIRDGHIYVSATGTLTIYTEPDPAITNGAAVPVGMTTIPAAGSLLLNGNALYGTSGRGGVPFAIDVHDPTAPVVTSPGPGDGIGTGMALVGDQLLVASRGGMTFTYDVGDKLHPVEDQNRTIVRNADGIPNYGIGRVDDLVLLCNDRGFYILAPTL
ncbi:MAG TPA: hypothetical protein VGM90_14325 [Kofleriaceae bacterium]|jgi:hypothetical protein